MTRYRITLGRPSTCSCGHWRAGSKYRGERGAHCSYGPDWDVVIWRSDDDGRTWQEVDPAVYAERMLELVDDGRRFAA